MRLTDYFVHRKSRSGSNATAKMQSLLEVIAISRLPHHWPPIGLFPHPMTSTYTAYASTYTANTALLPLYSPTENSYYSTISTPPLFTPPTSLYRRGSGCDVPSKYQSVSARPLSLEHLGRAGVVGTVASTVSGQCHQCMFVKK
jgi:hypothetical protein